MKIYMVSLLHRATIRKIEDGKKLQGKNIMSASATQGIHKKAILLWQHVTIMVNVLQRNIIFYFGVLAEM